MPRWVGRKQVLWRGEVVKAYRREAPDQMRVLDAFQAKRWPAKFDIRALVPADAKPKDWIGDTVKNLNRRLSGFRFHADGANGMYRH